MQSIQPVNGNVLIQFEEQKEGKSSGGIIIPDSAKEKPRDGKVVALAADGSDQVAVGDRVIFKEYAGTRITHEGTEYLIVPEAEILAKFVEVDAI